MRSLKTSLAIALLLLVLLPSVYYTAGPDRLLRFRQTHIPSEAYVEVIDPKDGVKWPYRVFKSSHFRPPNLTITGNGKPLADGYVFLNPKNRGGNGVEMSAPYIYTTDNELVFGADFTGRGGTTDFRVQDYGGKPHLTFWQGYSTRGKKPGHGYGEVVFLDGQYERFEIDLHDLHNVKRLAPHDSPGVIDIHEHQMTPWDSMLVTMYNNTPADLSSMGGPADGWVANSMVYEVDVKSGDVHFSWDPLDHIDLKTSHLPVTSYMGNGTHAAPWDFFHTNSIEAIDADHLLINSRHMWATYLVSRHTGSVLWHIEGSSGGDFGPLPEHGTFGWQHHARAHNVTPTSITLSWFDNHHYKEGPSDTATAGLVLQLPLPPSRAHSPKLARRVDLGSAHETFYAGSQGSFDADLPNGNQLLGYGEDPVAVEFGPGPDGTDVRWHARFGHDGVVQSYRAAKGPWKATPRGWGPSVFVEVEDEKGVKGKSGKGGSGMVGAKVFVSWNGATEVKGWDVFTAVDEGREMALYGVAKKRGFETVMEVQVPVAGCVRVDAVLEGEATRKGETACL